jgi:hypothetical protein
MNRSSVAFAPLLNLYSLTRIREAGEKAGFQRTTVDHMHKRDSLSMWSGDRLAKHLGTHVDAIWSDFPVPEDAQEIREQKLAAKRAYEKERRMHPRKGFKL